MNSTNWTEKSIIYINGRKLAESSGIQWIKHPKFDGVYMKNLFTGTDSNNSMNAMIVKIDPGHAIGDHIHEGKAELHEIIDGDGMAKIGNAEVNYKPGVVSFIPADILHNIRAGGNGIILLAKFTPPLN